MSFKPNTIKRFRFGNRSFDVQKSEARFEFFLDDIRFEEVLKFRATNNNTAINKNQILAIENSLPIASALLGISYFKAAAPKIIDDSALNLNEAEARFIEEVWLHGLGEFSHINQLDLSDCIKFNANKKTNNPVELNYNDNVLVPIGGGKDSMVTLEELRKNFNVCGFQLGDYAAINRMVTLADIPMIQVIRSIDKKLFTLNQEGAYNGHIPITSIYSITAVMSAILGGFSAVALSAERSADEGNLIEHGREINHQWSKGYAFEHGFQQTVYNTISSNLDYFSWLRPHSEFDIAKRFSQLSQYHMDFSSCNRSFHLDGAKMNGRWCANCPKCRFVFLILSPWIEPKKLIEIFGQNMLDDLSQQHGFESLLGIGGHKPFECVGEQAECALALNLATLHPLIANAKLTPRLLEKVSLSERDQQKLLESYLEHSTKHLIPSRFLTSCA